MAQDPVFLDPITGKPVAPTTPSPTERTAEAVRSVGEGVSGAWEMLNPVTALEGVVRYLYQPQATMADAATNMGLGFVEAAQEASAGRYGQAALSAARGFPIIGPIASNLKEGKTAKAVGNVAALVTPFAATRLPAEVGVKPFLQSPNPTLADAMSMAMREGVPLGTAEASARPFLRRAQYTLDAGTVAGLKDWERPVAKGFTDLAGRVVEDVRPGTPTTPELSGASVTKAVENVAKAYRAIGEPAYRDLHTMARDPQFVEQVPNLRVKTDPITQKVVKDKITGKPVKEYQQEAIEAPVDFRAAKQALQHRYDVLQRTMDPVKQEYSASFQALKAIMEGDDYVPLEVALEYYKTLGGKSEGTGAAGTRTKKEGLSAFSFGEVKQAIDARLRKMGLPAEKAFQDGRFAWRNMQRTNELLDAIAPTKEGVGREPVQTFDRLVRPGDVNIAMLRRVNAVAPAEMATLGRAALENHLTTILKHGDLDHTKAFLNWWDGLGDQTKLILYTDPKRVKKIGQLALAMKTWADSPNPSGTGAINQIAKFLHQTGIGPGASGAATVGTGLWGPQIAGSVVDVALHNPRIARTLVGGQGKIYPQRIAVGMTAGPLLGNAATQTVTPPKPMASHQQTVTRAQLEAVAADRGTDVATETARAKAEGYVIVQ
jgi:hypothetical protein